MIPIKIQCECGQRYSFDIEPINGKMPSSVACPVCGLDGTTLANEMIAKSLAAQPVVIQAAGMKLRAATMPTSHATQPISPLTPSRPEIHQSTIQDTKLTWYEQLWIALPMSLIIVGGMIGGACGGAAWAINRTVFKTVKNSILRYVWTGLISVLAAITYAIIATLFLSLFKRK